MLFGDVALSRELLRRSVELNPHILRRILAGTAPPDDFNRTPRELNSVLAGEIATLPDHQRATLGLISG